jgi:hypothetical protein
MAPCRRTGYRELVQRKSWLFVASSCPPGRALAMDLATFLLGRYLPVGV